MRHRDWVLAAGFVLTLAAVLVAVFLALHHEVHRRGGVPIQKRYLRLCYPNQGAGGC